MKALIITALFAFHTHAAQAGATDFHAIKVAFESYGGCAGRSCSTGDVGTPRESLTGEVTLVCFSEANENKALSATVQFTPEPIDTDTKKILTFTASELGLEATPAALYAVEGSERIFSAHLMGELKMKNGHPVIARIRQGLHQDQRVYIELQERVVPGFYSNWTYCQTR
ncbi:hypothetical protein K2X30_05170 [bacterium]|nr:hypothetical protein [bacterium]